MLFKLFITKYSYSYVDILEPTPLDPRKQVTEPNIGFRDLFNFIYSEHLKIEVKEKLALFAANNTAEPKEVARLIKDVVTWHIDTQITVWRCKSNKQ